MEPKQVPDSQRAYLAENFPDAELSRQWLADMVAGEVAELTELEEYLRTEIEEPAAPAPPTGRWCWKGRRVSGCIATR